MSLNNVNFMKPNTGAPLDIQTQQAMLAQEQLIAQALISRGMQDQSPVVHTGGGNQFARDIPNFGGPIGNWIDRKQGQEQMADVNRRQGELANETQRIRQSDIADALMARQGMPGIAGGPEDGGHAAVPADYNKYVKILMNSRSPELQKMGVEALKGIPTPEKILENANKSSAPGLAEFNRTLDPATLESRPTAHIQNNMATVTGDKGIITNQPTQTFTTKEVAPGLPAAVSDATGQATGIAGGTTTPPAKISEMLGGSMVKQLEEGKKDYLENTTRAQTIGQIRSQLSAIPEDAFGTASGFRNSMAKVGELLGGKKLSETADMQVLATETGKLVLEQVRKLAPVTEEDVKLMQKIVADQGMSKRALEQVMDIADAATQRAMNRHRATVSAFPIPEGSGVTREALEQTYAPPFTTASPLPPIGALGGGNKYKDMTTDDILKGLRGQ